MKQVLTLFFSFFSIIGFGQNRSSLQPDSVYKSLHVKMRIGVTDSRWAGASNETDTFDKDGHITENFEFSKFPGSPLRSKNAFTYDSLGMLQQKISKGTFHLFLLNRSVFQLITLYDYQLNNNIKTEKVYDTAESLVRETLYDYNLGTKTEYNIDSLGNRKIFREAFFDGLMDVYKSCYYWPPNMPDSCFSWKNEFDKQGRIKKCSITEKNNNFALIYKYQSNGLLSAIETQGGSSPGTERFRYEYWK